MDTKRLVTISVPVYNEQDNIAPLLSALRSFTASEPAYDFEFLFTDNASTDQTFDRLKAAAVADSRIRILSFSRNFGFQKSILTNYLNARGDACVQIDADLQDPPSLIAEFLRHWERGYKVVYGVRRRRQESATSSLGRKFGYWVLSGLSEADLPRDAGDFRLVDRVIIEKLRQISDQTPYLRGLIASLGYAQVGVPYDRSARTAGKSKFNFWSILRLGFDGVCSQSTKLLQYITVLAFAVMGLTVVLGGGYLLMSLLTDHNLPAGFTTLVLLQLGTIGLNALLLGIIGEYVGRTYNNVRGLPLTIVERRVEKGEETRELTAPPSISSS